MNSVRMVLLQTSRLYGHLRSSRHQAWKAVSVCSNYCTAAEASLVKPVQDGAEKEYPEKIKNIVSGISKLTLLEVSDLNELLKITLNIKDAPMMAMGAMPVAAANESEEAAPTAQTEFTLKLLKFEDTKKVALIKKLQKILSDMNLVQIKKFVESSPVVVKKDITKEEADELKASLEETGAQCEIL